MTRLPPQLEAAVNELIRAAGLSGRAADAVRRDLRRHFHDGLASGRTPEELLARFGTPEQVAPALAAAAVSPPATVPRSRPLADLRADVRHGLRGLRRAPALTGASLAVLTLGIAANVIVSSVANALLLRPIPVEDPSTLVDVWADVEGGNSFAGFSWPDVVAYRDEATTLSSLAAFTGIRATLGSEEAGQPVIAQIVSADYLPMMGVGTAVGRADLPPDAAADADPVAVLAHAFWQSAFGGDPGVVGRTLRIDGHAVDVIGVAAAPFEGHFIGFPVDLWLPVAAAGTFLAGFDPADPAAKPFEMIARLRPGADAAAAQQELSAVAERLEARYTDANRGHGVGVTSTTGLDHSLGAGVRTFVAVLSTVALLVLVVACLNVGGMLLVRTMAREREMAVRTALGAGRLRLVRHLVVESGLLVAAAVVAGVGLGTRGTAWLEAALPALSGGLGLDLSLDARVVALTALAAGAAVLLAGAAPALHLLRRDPADALRARSGAGRAGGRTRTALVVAQVAGSVVLVTLTGLFLRALVDGARVRPGFDPDRVAHVPVRLDDGVVGDGDPEAALQELLEAMAVIPGLDAVAVADQPVIGVVRSPAGLEVPGILPPPGRDRLTVDARRVGPGYFAAVGIALRQGRAFDATDRAGPSAPAVVNRAFVDRYWPGGDAVGRSIRVDGADARIVGVAEDARFLVQDLDPDPLVYLPLAGRVPLRVTVILAGDRPERRAAEVRAALAGVLPLHPAATPTSARRVLQDALLPQRIGAGMIGAMGAAALLLAGVGLYGLVRFGVARDAHAIGIRLALGSSRAGILSGVLRRTAVPVAIGLAAGLGLSALGTPLLAGLLPGVAPHDPAVYAVVVATLVAVVMTAGLVPAGRATRIQPAEVLRES